MIPTVFECLTNLEEKIKFYFPLLNTKMYDWARNLFMKISSNIDLKIWEEELASLYSVIANLKPSKPSYLLIHGLLL